MTPRRAGTLQERAMRRLLSGRARHARVLRKELDVPKNALNRALRAMVARGWVTRTLAERQGRDGHPGYLYRLTDLGRQEVTT